ncbi:MBL fold metallo-hydrolase RNA specificity domain-containing protein [Photobacterium lutimaris]|uniref:MBL fold hydrolase n=1 Tax=Photobacterium lutimaris TaxID=388278 RepID=A0A2T3IXC2_9GAMM|nr:MBL fold metallo-hydrolase [Photobacterium lutimaris]PSU33186.1 MBL fold hydrolase [Photobacterium lutimaris]TDR75235.1 metallo-beta-lactamase family protein [Photobacterium lutimaris]
MQIIHHGAYEGVTGSCHELQWGGNGILIDCGLFQGSEAPRSLNIDFPVGHIQALVLTHCHIDHIGRIPWLLAAGFRGPIYATEATAALLPLMLDDGLKIQLNLNKAQRSQFLQLCKSLLRPVPFDCQAPVILPNGDRLVIYFRQAGHILGSAYVEVVLPDSQVVVFSGDLGPSNTPLLVDPVSPVRADVLVLESTYGNRQHQRHTERSENLKQIIDQSLLDGGAILIPAFSVGRTQELLFDIESLIAETFSPSLQADSDRSRWRELPIILDSPLADDVTKQYEMFYRLWEKEAIARKNIGRHPLSFDQCITVDSHQQHQSIVNRLSSTKEPAVVVAASGMCSGGRIVNYLEALLPEPCTDVVMVGYQAKGTLGYALSRGQKRVEINGKTIDVKAKIHNLSGYSAHADQSDLVKFVANIEQGPKKIHLVHGDYRAQHELAQVLQSRHPDCDIVIAADQKTSTT